MEQSGKSVGFSLGEVSSRGIEVVEFCQEIRIGRRAIKVRHDKARIRKRRNSLFAPGNSKGTSELCVAGATVKRCMNGNANVLSGMPQYSGKIRVDGNILPPASRGPCTGPPMQQSAAKNPMPNRQSCRTADGIQDPCQNCRRT